MSKENKIKYFIPKCYQDILQDKLILAYIWCSKELMPNKVKSLDRAFMQNQVNKYLDFRLNVAKNSYFNFDYMASLGYDLLKEIRK